MDVAVIGSFAEGLPIGRFCLRRPPGVLQHVGVLDADVGTQRRHRQHRRVGFGGSSVLAGVAQPVGVADLRLAVGGFCGSTAHTRRGRSPSTMIRHNTRLSRRS